MFRRRRLRNGRCVFHKYFFAMGKVSLVPALCDTLAVTIEGAMKQPEHPSRTPSPVPRKRRNLLLKLAALALLAFGLPFLLDVVLAPWAFFMGGHFHLNPKWAGWGRMHSNSSSDYAIYITISPSLGRGHSFTDISGKGALCTPRGDNYRHTMAGSFEPGSGVDLQGRTATICPHNYDRKHTGHNDPSLEFRGRWNNPDLVLDDQGSVNQAFGPDGRLAQKKHARSDIQERVSLSLHEGSRSDFDAVCAALKGK
jgi:hypothetical protein